MEETSSTCPARPITEEADASRSALPGILASGPRGRWPTPTKNHGSNARAREKKAKAWENEFRKIVPTLQSQDFDDHFLFLQPLIDAGVDPAWLLPRLQYLGGKIEHARSTQGEQLFSLNAKTISPKIKSIRAATRDLRELVTEWPFLRLNASDLEDDLVRILLDMPGGGWVGEEKVPSCDVSDVDRQRAANLLFYLPEMMEAFVALAPEKIKGQVEFVKRLNSSWSHQPIFWIGEYVHRMTGKRHWGALSTALSLLGFEISENHLSQAYTAAEKRFSLVSPPGGGVRFLVPQK